MPQAASRNWYPVVTDPKEIRSRLENRYNYLRFERSTWRDHWRELSENIRPRRFRWNPSDRYRSGTQRNQKILNNTATRSSRVCASGLHAGVTSPARPWFRLTLDDPELMERQDVRQWLAEVEDRMRQIFSRSNLYSSLPTLYGDMADYGTGCMMVDEDDEDVIRTTVMPIGCYALAQDHSYRVQTFYHETTRTAEQLVTHFGIENVSPSTADLYHSTPDAWVECIQVIEPNDDRMLERKDWAGMKYRSVWYEYQENHKGDDGLLGMMGFNEFPVMAPRWSTVGEDVYGECPGMDALPDIKGLQHLEKRRAQALDKIVNPPMNAPASMRRRRASILTGDVNYYRREDGAQRFEPAHLVDPKVAYLGDELLRYERRIESTYFVDLFMMLTMRPGVEKTAREVDELHEEKMLQLGPVLENLHDELLEPLINRTFAIMERRGLIPEPPEEIVGVDYGVELISVLAQAQKLVGTVAVERQVEMAIRMSEGGMTEALETIDPDAVMRHYAKLLGTEPDLLRSLEEVQQRRQERAEQEQMAAGAESLKNAGQGAAALGSASLTDQNALGAMLGGLGQ